MWTSCIYFTWFAKYVNKLNIIEVVYNEYKTFNAKIIDQLDLHRLKIYR